jgi:hypothetical protein
VHVGKNVWHSSWVSKSVVVGAFVHVLSTQVPIQTHGPPLELVDVLVHCVLVLIILQLLGLATHPYPLGATIHPDKYVLHSSLLSWLASYGAVVHDLSKHPLVVHSQIDHAALYLQLLDAE